MSISLTGWILDIYDLPSGKVAVWVIGEDGTRRRLMMQIPITFYASGNPRQLQYLEQCLEKQVEPYQAFLTHKKEVYHHPSLIPVLAIVGESPAVMRKLFLWVSTQFPNLTYYDVDISTTIRLTALYEIFPLCHCQFQADGDDIESVQPLETRWQLDPSTPPLRMLEIGLEHTPERSLPKQILLKWDRYSIKVDVEPERAMLINLGSILNKYEPDIILTDWGDRWLLQYLEEAGERRNHKIHLNRDMDFNEIRVKAERTYHSYGVMIHKTQQRYLYGRVHIDRYGTIGFGDHGLEGVMETARITGQGLQTAARVSPGTGVSSMQMITALQHDILVPYRSQKAEITRSLSALMESDRGGVIFEPPLGIYQNVASLDYAQLFPTIQMTANLSPETKQPDGTFDKNAPPGIIPMTLRPMLKKRMELKKALEVMNKVDPRYQVYKARSSGIKMVAICLFGYNGFHLAKFGCIEAHEEINRLGRAAILKAKEIAESEGFECLSIYIDGITLKKDGASTPEDFQVVKDRIEQETGLPIALDGVFSWIAFTSSKADERVPVANRYFGCYKGKGGENKLRGVESRRRDSPPWIADFQIRLLAMFAREPDPAKLTLLMPDAIRMIQTEVSQLKAGKIGIAELTISHRISRDVADFRSNSPAARAGAILASKGKIYKAGMVMQFIYINGFSV